MKAKAHPSAAVSAAPTHEQIAIRAQSLWRELGCPECRDDEIWLDAERQLRRSSLPRQLESDAGPEERMDELDAIYPDPSTSRETTSL